MNDHVPSLFDQTVRDTDEEFYATFPQARVANIFLLQHLHHWSNPPVNPAPHNIPQPTSDYPQQYDLTPPVITQPTFDPLSSISFIPHTSSDLAGPSASNSTGFPEKPLNVDQIRSRDTLFSPIHQGRKLRRVPRSPTPDGRELSVMHLDDFSEPLSSRESGTQINYFHTNQRRAHSVSQPPSRSLTWDSTMSSSKASIRLSPLPSKRQLEKKPPLACLFCRGRKIACGPPLPGSPDKTCNQCQRRSLRCEYPSESRRGMRKKKSSAVAEADN